MKNLNTRIMLIQTLAFFSIGYAMEQEKPVPPKEELFFELFTQLPSDLQKDIIGIAVAQVEGNTLHEIVTGIKKNLMSLTLVSKNFKELINSATTTNAILNTLLENKDIQNFFERVAKEYIKERALLPIDKLTREKIKELMQLKTNTRKKILLAFIPTTYAQEKFKELATAEKDAIEYGILLQLATLLSKFFSQLRQRIKEDPKLPAFLSDLLFITKYLKEQFNLYKPLDENSKIFINKKLNDYKAVDI